jgi:hypothetical protein
MFVIIERSLAYYEFCQFTVNYKSVMVFYSKDPDHITTILPPHYFYMTVYPPAFPFVVSVTLSPYNSVSQSV